MNNQPKWEEAPEGATHWAPESNDFLEAWYKKDEHGSWFCVACDSYREFKSGWYWLGKLDHPRYGNENVYAKGQSK